MNTLQKLGNLQDRRQFLRSSAMGLGAAALGSLMTEAFAASPGAAPHFPASARRVIFLFMAGAPSQLDLFD